MVEAKKNNECPFCHKFQQVKKYGKTKNGTQRYFCVRCNKSFVIKPKKDFVKNKVIISQKKNMPWDKNRMMKCPKCNDKDKVKRNGLTRSNYQRYHCIRCNISFSRKSKAPHTIHDDYKAKMLLYLISNGLNLKSTAKFFNISRYLMKKYIEEITGHEYRVLQARYLILKQEMQKIQEIGLSEYLSKNAIMNINDSFLNEFNDFLKREIQKMQKDGGKVFMAKRGISEYTTFDNDRLFIAFKEYLENEEKRG